MELIHDALCIERVAGRTRAQAMVEGDIMPPAGKAGMSNVLSVEGRVALDGVEALEGRLSIEGTIELFVMYVDDSDAVNGFTSTSGFKHAVEIAGVAPGMRAKAVPSLQQLDFSLSDEKTLRVRAIIDMDCTVMEKAMVEALQGVADIKDLEMKALNLSLVEEGEPQTMNLVLRESMRIPQGLPPVGYVMYSTAMPRVMSVSIEDGKAAVEGEVRITTIYASDSDEHAPIQQVQHTMPFGQLFSIDPSVKEASVMPEVREIEVVAADDENKNILELEIKLWLTLTASRRREARALEDAYSPTRNVSALKNKVELRQAAAEGTGRCMVRDTISVPETMPAAARALYVTARPVVTDEAAGDDRFTLHGILFARVVYVCREGRLHGFGAEIPFRCEIEAPHMTEDMEADVRVMCESATVSGSGDALDVKITLECAIRGYSTSVKSIVMGLEEMEPLARVQGVVVYFASKGEACWDIAKRFCIPQKDLKECNPDLPDEMQNGEKVLLLLRN